MKMNTGDFIEENDIMKVMPLQKDRSYREKEIGHAIGKTGKVVHVSRSYQAPEMYLLFFKDTLEHISFFEMEVKLVKKG